MTESLKTRRILAMTTSQEVDFAITNLQQRKRIKHGLNRRLLHVYPKRQSRGYILQFDDQVHMHMDVHICTNRMKHADKKVIIRKNREANRLGQTVFIHHDQKLETITRKIIECIKTYYNAMRRYRTQMNDAEFREYISPRNNRAILVCH